MTMTDTQPEDREAQLRRVACELFISKGFEATSMDSIARAAGVSKRTPYLYYENKHDLFSAVVLIFLREIEAELAPLWGAPRSGIEALKTAAHAYAAYAIADPARFQLVMTFERRDFVPGRADDLPAYAKACQAANDRMTQSLWQTISRAKSQGDLVTPLDPRQYGLLLWSGLAGVVSIAVERKTSLSAAYDWTPEEMVGVYIDHFFSSSPGGDDNGR